MLAFFIYYLKTLADRNANDTDNADCHGDHNTSVFFLWRNWDKLNQHHQKQGKVYKCIGTYFLWFQLMWRDCDVLTVD